MCEGREVPAPDTDGHYINPELYRRDQLGAINTLNKRLWAPTPHTERNVATESCLWTECEQKNSFNASIRCDIEDCNSPKQENRNTPTRLRGRCSLHKDWRSTESEFSETNALDQLPFNLWNSLSHCNPRAESTTFQVKCDYSQNIL